MMVGRLLSYWEGKFSGAMLYFGRVYIFTLQELDTYIHIPTNQTGRKFGTSSSTSKVTVTWGVEYVIVPWEGTYTFIVDFLW